ncbi:MFS transporter [Enterobacter sp. BIGb0383]|uniref:MFS transporter n=2 Tax=unclassified Enterobacter TaxID=2608935 RepID=UPI000F46BB4E|nr:MFS transporter [Enterobacter sp. BIGb0383]ROP59192.1 MFS transporter [Enterobacter sp. BIGb0383]ROS09342.1 MFS transporter [Enterobacter sp. BIGb0359]
MPATLTSPATHMRGLQFLAACLTGLLIPLCFTGPAVVLPAIGQALGGSPTQLSWIMNAYILSYGGAMMVAGSLTDIYGRRRLWLTGLAGFCVFTFAIPFAPSVLWIDLLRLLQGLGGAAAFAAAMSSLAPLFTGAARARAFSLLGTTFGLGLSFGPLVSGWMVEASGWQSVFYTTGIIGVLGLGLVAVSTRHGQETVSGTPDWPGAITFTLALGLFTWGMLRVPESGWHDILVVTALLASGVVFIGFTVIERRAAHPMLDLDFFRDPGFLGVQVLAASPAFLFILLIVILPGRFIGIDGYGALQAGKMMVWLAAPLLLVPFLAALLTRWFRPGSLSAVGLLLVAAGLVWLASGFAQGGGQALHLPLLLIGIGIGVPWGLMDAMAVSVVSPERVGMATGIFNTVRVSADGVAIAMIGALLATLIQHRLSQAALTTPQEALLEASSRAALGEIHTASSLLPGFESLLSQSYAASFITILYVLAGLAVLTACAVYTLLRVRQTQTQR